jgi:hypothetical protein
MATKGKAQSAIREQVWQRCQRPAPPDSFAAEDARLDNLDAVADGYAPEVSVRPLRLHTQQVEEGGLGGHRFSRGFAQYLAKVKPVLTEQEEKQVRYWWASDYGRQRVERRFVQRFGSERGATAYHVALTVASQFWGADAYERIIAETSHSAGWIARMAHLALDFAS